LERVAVIQMQHIAYKGSAPAPQDLAGGQIDLLFEPTPSVTPLITVGKLRPIAVTALTRVKAQPDLPTLAESGYPDLDISTWCG